MKHIFVDFEMNPIDKQFKEARELCKSEIIEIGAVILNDSLEKVSEFKKYVKPEYNKISKKCSKLTGITDEILESAPNFKDAIEEFMNWCKENCEDEEFKIYEWSENDLKQLVKEINLKQISSEDFEMFIVDWCDFQKEYCRLLGVEKRISLSMAISSIGEEFEGQVHDALWDAKNTASIFILSKNEEKFYRIMQPVLEALKPNQPMTYTLEDMLKKKLDKLSIMGA